MVISDEVYSPVSFVIITIIDDCFPRHTTYRGAHLYRCSLWVDMRSATDQKTFQADNMVNHLQVSKNSEIFFKSPTAKF